MINKGNTISKFSPAILFLIWHFKNVFCLPSVQFYLYFGHLQAAISNPFISQQSNARSQCHFWFPVSVQNDYLHEDCGKKLQGNSGELNFVMVKLIYGWLIVKRKKF